MTGPNVPASGPEDGARCRCGHAKSEHRKFPCGLGCTVTEGDYWADSCTDFRPVVADTTAGEADCVLWGPPQRMNGQWMRLGVSSTMNSAARSGGAQDDGLRGRIEALAEELERDSATYAGGLSRTDAATRLRRALAGPDDARRGRCQVSGADALREAAVYERLLEALCLATPPCQDHRDDAAEALPVVLRYGLDKAAEELRAIGRAGLAATPGPHPVRVPVGYLFDRADALTAQDPT